MRIPSEVDDRYWILQVNERYEFKKPREERNSGKWLIFDSIKNIDALWRVISEAVINGKLGPSAKASTAKPNPNAQDNLTRVICVFTEDYNDKKDLKRIEDELRQLGVENQLIYKLDRNVGKYAHKGDEVIVEEVRKKLD